MRGAGTPTSAPKRQERVVGRAVQGGLSPGRSSAARVSSLPPTQGQAPGSVPWTFGARPAPHPAVSRAPGPLPPPPCGSRGSHLCAKSPGAGGKLPATCHKEALFSGEVVLWPAVRQPSPPLSALAAARTPRPLSLLLGRALGGGGSSLLGSRAPVIAGLGQAAALPAPPRHPGGERARAPSPSGSPPHKPRPRVGDPDKRPCPGLAVWEARGPCHPPPRSLRSHTGVCHTCAKSPPCSCQGCPVSPGPVT